MNRIKHIILIIFFALLIAFFVLCFLVFMSDDQDACLDSGVCKEGLTLNMENGEEVIINKETCKQYNGEWREKHNDCYFRNF